MHTPGSTERNSTTVHQKSANVRTIMIMSAPCRAHSSKKSRRRRCAAGPS